MAEENLNTEELSEDEQFAAAIADSPLFDDHAPQPGGKSVPGKDQGDADVDPGTAGNADAGKEGDSGEPGKGADANVDAPDDDPKDQGKGGDQSTASDTNTGDAQDEPFPGYANLSSEAREAFDKLKADREKFENDYKALHGMTAPLQRGNAELRRQAEAMAARIQQLEQLERKQQDVSAAKDATIQEYDEWAKQFPEESKAVSALVNPLREKVTALEGSLQAARAELGNLHADRQQAALAREIGELEKVHSDWRSIHDSPDYWEWLGQQSPGIQSLNQSMFAGDTIQLLNLYKSAHAPRQAPAPAPSNPPSNTADAVQQRRKQSLERGTQPTARSSESTSSNRGVELTDEDAQFASIVADNPFFE